MANIKMIIVMMILFITNFNFSDAATIKVNSAWMSFTAEQKNSGETVMKDYKNGMLFGHLCSGLSDDGSKIAEIHTFANGNYKDNSGFSSDIIFFDVNTNKELKAVKANNCMGGKFYKFGTKEYYYYMNTDNVARIRIDDGSFKKEWFANNATSYAVINENELVYMNAKKDSQGLYTLTYMKNGKSQDLRDFSTVDTEGITSNMNLVNGTLLFGWEYNLKSYNIYTGEFKLIKKGINNLAYALNDTYYISNYNIKSFKDSSFNINVTKSGEVIQAAGIGINKNYDGTYSITRDSDGVSQVFNPSTGKMNYITTEPASYYSLKNKNGVYASTQTYILKDKIVTIKGTKIISYNK